jgi:hypothetical protein
MSLKQVLSRIILLLFVVIPMIFLVRDWYDVAALVIIFLIVWALFNL